jgi:hypothetical protein
MLIIKEEKELKLVKAKMLNYFPEQKGSIESLFLLDDLRLSVTIDGQWKISGITPPYEYGVRDCVTLFVVRREDGSLDLDVMVQGPIVDC